MGVYSRLVESRSKQATEDGEGDAALEPPLAATSVAGAVANVGERVQEILDAAERIANEIREEAAQDVARQHDERRREADRIVEDRIRELGTLTEALASRATTVQREAAALVDEMEYARRRLTQLAGIGDPPAPPVAAPPAAAPDAPEPVAYPGSGQPRRSPEEARLRATQMAIAGSGRDEIEASLRSELGVPQPAAIVDEVLGR